MVVCEGIFSQIQCFLRQDNVFTMLYWRQEKEEWLAMVKAMT